MAKEVPVSSILQIFFSNIFSLLVVFIFGFMVSYFFSSAQIKSSSLVLNHRFRYHWEAAQGQKG